MVQRPAVVDAGDLTFNANPSAEATIEGWQDGLHPEMELLSAGGRYGVVAAPPKVKEQIYTLTGTLHGPVEATHAEMEDLRAQLLGTFPLGVLVPLKVTTDKPRTAWVLLYDKPTITWGGNRLDFTLPLLSPDPLKYGDAMTGVMGAFAGSPSYRLYDTTSHARTYVVAGAHRTYVVDLVQGTYPEATIIDSPGSEISRRLTFEVTGPLDAGDWVLWNETTEQQMWVDITLDAGQTLVLDAYTRTATIGGASVAHQVYGDWPHLAPGVNTFRLSTGATNDDAFAVVTAEPAYQ